MMATKGLGSTVVLNVLLWLSLVISIPLAGFHPIYVSVAVTAAVVLLAIATFRRHPQRGDAGRARLAAGQLLAAHPGRRRRLRFPQGAPRCRPQSHARGRFDHDGAPHAARDPAAWVS